MNNSITLIDVRNEAMDAIKKLKEDKLDIKTASEIRNLLGVIIDTAKTQVEFIKALPPSLKERLSEETIRIIAGALPMDNDEDKKLKYLQGKSPYAILEEINKENE